MDAQPATRNCRSEWSCPLSASPSLLARLHRPAKLDGTDVAVLGVPIDTASGYRIGTCAIREMSMFHGLGGGATSVRTSTETSVQSATAPLVTESSGKQD
jgi:hypothetical protein